MRIRSVLPVLAATCLGLMCGAALAAEAPLGSFSSGPAQAQGANAMSIAAVVNEDIITVFDVQARLGLYMATSGLEMSQNSYRLSWSREEVDQKLHGIMKSIHATCVKYGTEGKWVNYVNGANIGGFVKVADAMLAQGLV